MKSIKLLWDKLKNLKRKDVCYIIAIFLLILTIVPIFIASGYAVLSADDFSAMKSIREAEGGILLFKIINTVRRLYFQWSAGYGGIIIEYTIAWFIMKNRAVVGISLIVSFIILLLSLRLFIKCFMEYFKIESGERHIMFWAYVCILVPFLGYNSYPEVMYWFVGNLSYDLSISLNLLVISSMMIIDKKGKKWMYIPAVLLALLMGGMSIQSGLPACFFMLILNLDQIRRHKKIVPAYAIPSIMAVIGYAIHVFAPGNFVRHDSLDSTGLHPFAALRSSIYTAADELTAAFKNPYLLIGLIIMLFLGIKSAKEIKINGYKFTFTLVISFMMMVATCFTVLLGYSASGIEALPVRCMFVFDFVTYTCLVVCAFACGVYIKRWSGLSVSPDLKVVTAAVIVIIAFTNAGTMFQDASWKNMLSDIAHGQISDYNKSVNEILDTIENSEEADVVIDTLPECPDTFNPFFITSDPYDWYNTAVADYYGKNSVKTDH
ncbi:MAG: DUF6056 family protein [Butyrivibrio sp.]|uniref:DUF6056 family protein n=1 Tax=Butyrivibrio sp. TaxID=28121 RepID=UPI0025D22EA4|nr:DUF6056 family protein [Butyrivibrio sp.]MCR5773018.1 DUF6056 family protein [Butyrivibrio sp.]